MVNNLEGVNTKAQKAAAGKAFRANDPPASIAISNGGISKAKADTLGGMAAPKVQQGKRNKRAVST